MMEVNEDGKMEFPRDLMVQDCLENAAEPLFGFVTNVTLLNDEPCVQDVECFENGTRIDSGDEILSDVDDLLLDIEKDESLNNSNTHASTNNETSTISDRDLVHRMATIGNNKNEQPQIQMFEASEGVFKANNTLSGPIKSGGLPSSSLLKHTTLHNTTLNENSKALFLRIARVSFSDPDFSRDIDYNFRKRYLTTYRKKGPYEVKSLMPEFRGDHPSLSRVHERSDVNYDGNLLNEHY